MTDYAIEFYFNRKNIFKFKIPKVGNSSWDKNFVDNLAENNFNKSSI